ncbi:hypothetical protein [Herbaspirillum sp. RV1423]|uniref:hypothetical protein n=1 Tax=Herbaspirillum sp. RV1423 TaxID=1443993 RepID=UPI0009DEB1C6|nr:hypothetical protein [Herbaspirillum sp. RV1423]
MEDQFLRPPESSFPLWGLVHTPSRDDADTGMQDQTFYINIRNQGGVLTFASALDAEIYCQRLYAAGMQGWTRQRLERIDLARIMATIPAEERKLMLALGFFASDTNDLLLDSDQTLITPLLPVPFDMHHTLHGMSQLRIKADVLAFIHEWWERIGGMNYSEQVHSLGNWSDIALAKCATEALEKAQVVGLAQYRDAWTSIGTVEECAVFVPESGAWQFTPLDGPRNRLLH